MDSKIDNFSVKVLRTVNYNTVEINVTYTYTGNNPKGFSPKQVDALVEATLVRGDVALEKLKARLSMPATITNK